MEIWEFRRENRQSDGTVAKGEGDTDSGRGRDGREVGVKSFLKMWDIKTSKEIRKQDSLFYKYLHDNFLK